jgi:hypothetical protein
MSDSEQTVLQVIQQRLVTFYNDELIAVQSAEGDIYVSIRHLCDVLGLNRRGQVQRIQRNMVLARGYRVGVISTSGGDQNAGLLRVDLLPLWLTGLSTKSIRAEMQQQLERYQDEAAKILWEAFQEGRLTADESVEDLLQTSSSEAAQAYRMLQALVKLARNQVLLETKIFEQATQLNVHEQQLVGHSARIEEIEATLGVPERQITPDQAMQISQAVKAIAHELGRRSGRNEYGGVYGELYRRYSVNSYKALPANKFDAALNWLNQWLQMLTGEDDVAF